MKRRSRTGLRRTVVCSASALLAVAASAFVPDQKVVAQESAPAGDDAAEEGVGDWILRLFRGSDESEDPPRSGDRRGNGNSGSGGGGNYGSSGGGGGGGSGGNDGGGGDDGGDDGGEGGGDDGGGDNGGEGGEGGNGGEGGEGEGGNDD